MKKILVGAVIGVACLVGIMWLLEYLDYEGEKNLSNADWQHGVHIGSKGAFGYRTGQGIA